MSSSTEFTYDYRFETSKERALRLGRSKFSGRMDLYRKPMPRSNSMVFMFLKHWKEQGDNGLSFSNACLHWQQLQRQSHRPVSQLGHIAMGMSRILKSYGFKLGEPGSKTPWIFA